MEQLSDRCRGYMVMMASTMLVRLIVVMMMVKLVMVMISEMTMTMMKMMIMVVIRRKTMLAVEHFFCLKQGDKFKMRQNGIAL